MTSSCPAISTAISAEAQGAAKPLHIWPGDSALEMAGFFDQILDRVLRTARIGEYAEVPAR